MTTDERPAPSHRIQSLKANIMNRPGSFPAEVNPFSCTAALMFASGSGKSRVQVRASYLHELVKLARIEIEAEWTLAGQHLPTAHMGLQIPELDNASHPQQLQQIGIDAGKIGAVRECVKPWQNPPRCAVGSATPESLRGKGNWGGGDSRTVFWAWGWMENHSIRDYAKVIRSGFGGVRREIEEAMAGADRAAPGYAQAENFWLAHILTCGEDGINANSLGRLDQFLYPCYAADLAAGRIDRQGAVELMEELGCRLYLDYDVQAITLGGVNRAGEDAVNELSYVILDATQNLGFVRDLSVRLHRNSPPAFVQRASELIARGGGIPFIFNDECFVPALTGRGIALKDARDYAPIGCVELTIPGRANPHAVSGWFNSTKCVELALFNGRDPASGEQVGPRTGEFADFGTFEDFFAAYTRQVETFAGNMVYHCNRGELAQRDGGPLPCWSVLTDDCIRRGRDITDGGPVYNYHSICFLGTANTADCLIAVKQFVFDEPRVPRAELLAALQENFKGQESLRQMLLKRAPKYGNDQREVDNLARRVCEHFIGLMDRMQSPLNGRYFVHLFSFLCNLDFGKSVGATPDGRLAGEPLAYSLSANQGRDTRGVTAMLNSLAQLPHDQAAGASAAIVEIDPVLVDGEAGIRILAQLIETAMRMGVGQLQWNVTSVERLRQAQKEPEKYGNLAVRVAGYSQMFKLINPELQEHIIARTKHRG